MVVMSSLRALFFCGFLSIVKGFTTSTTSRRIFVRVRSSILLPTRPVSVSCATRRKYIGTSAARKSDFGDDPSASSDDRARADNTENTSDQAAPSRQRTKEEDDAILGYAIDSFLRGDYNLNLPDDDNRSFPPPDIPGEVVSAALRSLRGQDLPSQTHGAALFMRFCLPLRRSERWGDASSIGKDPWKEILRGALTASALVRRIRASEFAGLLDWSRMDVTEGAFTSDRDLVGLPSIAYVNAALYFEENSEPSLFQFKLQRVGGGAWMIDTVRRSQKELFLDTDRTGSSSSL